MSWEGSDRGARLPRDWSRIRARVLRRDGRRCQIPGPSGVRCGEPANEVDHIAPGDDHRPENLRAACRRCHALKSSREGNASKSVRRRPSERHPGDLT
ncbi:HNH endonuclease [Micromonospora sp. NIE111]|nr:HNH endonuclease [Micromonospora hortensis]